MAMSAAIPQLTSFLVDELGASLPVAGLYSLTNLTAPLVGFAIGRVSDRRDDRLTLFRAGAVVEMLGWVAMGLATRIWMPFVIAVVALGLAGAATAQVYAAARDERSRHPSSFDVEVISTIRMAYTLGWVVGPVVGSVLGGALGVRAVLLAAPTCSSSRPCSAGWRPWGWRCWPPGCTDATPAGGLRPSRRERGSCRAVRLSSCPVRQPPTTH
jgi:MFS transporter, SET family, sugar efflux transporter